MRRIKKRILEAVIRSKLKSAFNSKNQTLLIAVSVGVCGGYLVALKRRRTLPIGLKKIGTDQPNPTQQNVSTALREDLIAALAYQLWQDRGCPFGSDKEDWFRAEQELKGRAGSIATA
jgi:hypothetical protein